MKIKKFFALPLILAFFMAVTSCEDTTTTIGSVITEGEVIITNDTLTAQKLYGKPVRIENFDSKTGNLMIGSIQAPQYGKLNCSFVSRLMCAANLEIPDSLFSMPNFVDRVDSCKLIFGAQRSEITGDSLTPQKLNIFQLTKQLPSDINNTFDPEGYYDPSMPLASKSYTVSEISSSDSAFYNNRLVNITVDLPVDFGKEIILKYQQEPSIFQWPQTMAENFLKGIFVKPVFGNGCIANINTVYVAVFYHTLKDVKEENEDGEQITVQKHVTNMVVPFTVSPEVLSSNNINYQPSDFVMNKNSSTSGDVVITTPGGYIAEIQLPVNDLIARYKAEDRHLSIVNELMLYIPAETFDEDSGIGIAESVLMVKSSEYENFFNGNKTPDNLTSFTGVYDSVKKRYYFTSLRNYFLNLLQQESISEEDYTFTLVPVEITTETSNSYYGEGTTYVTKCVPYTIRPTMSLLNTNDATITFSYSTQVIQ